MSELIVKKITVGALSTNCYLLCDGSRTAVIDPGAKPKTVCEAVAALGCPVEYILLTHGHFDHIGALARLKEEHPSAKIVINVADSEMLTSPELNYSLSVGTPVEAPEAELKLIDGDTLDFGERVIKMLHTPGHSAGSCCYYVENLLFCGDTIFYGDVGRTDLHGGSEKQLADSLERIMLLPDDTVLYPGHGRSSELRREMLCNRYLQ